MEVRHSPDVVVNYMLIRAGGTLKDGRQADYWVHATTWWQESHERRLVTHEHISLPVDMKSGRAVMDLVP
jgi:ketosteroid isomerase-like protein